MKENSREEDINRCNKLTETTNANWIGISNQLAIKHILSDYKRVLKENEELKDKYATFVKMSCEIVEQSIPVQKVKDKIEELKNKPLKINQNDKYYYETDAYNKIVVQVLQELLEGRK